MHARAFRAFFIYSFLLAFLSVMRGYGQAGEARLFTNKIGMAFIKVEAGSFMMGSPETEKGRGRDEKLRRVSITRPFYLQETEVTVEQWKAVMGGGIRRDIGAGRLPVNRVSWHDCMRFIARLNETGQGVYRLPTEAEWEYACRAGSTTAYSWGEEITCERALYANNKRGMDECTAASEARGFPVSGPVPVGSFPPNAWGFYDMHGNVWEWCADWYGPYGSGDVIDPKGPSDGRYKVRRGGSWFKDGSLCRCANRTYAHPASRYDTVGLRLVRVSD